MDTMGVFWVVTGGSLCAVLVLLTVVWVQWLQATQHKAELAVLRDLLRGLGDIIRGLEQENSELTAGLRAERGQAELLKRQLGQLR
jgi:ABC-type transporter Mla subunit MlaD